MTIGINNRQVVPGIEYSSHRSEGVSNTRANTYGSPNYGCARRRIGKGIGIENR
jgi:hypothetical protein